MTQVMGARYLSLGGMAAALLLLGSSLSGCAYRWQLSEPASKPQPTDPGDPDPELSGLLSVRRQLEERLARVERQLAADEPATDPAQREEQLVERLSITVALTDLDRAIVERRQELDLAPPAAAASPPPSPPDPAKLVARAEERVAVHQRSQRLGDVGQAVAGKGLADLLGSAGGAGAAAVDLPNRGKGTGYDFEDDSGLDVAEGGEGRATDLDDLLSALPPKRKKASGAPPSTGEKKEAPKRIWRPNKQDKDYKTRIKAAVVNAGGPPPDVMPAVRRHRGQLLACLPSELRDGGLRITVRARIAASGRFRAPQVTGEPALSPDVAACVADVIQRIEIPPQGDSRSVRFSLVFQGS